MVVFGNYSDKKLLARACLSGSGQRSLVRLVQVKAKAEGRRVEGRSRILEIVFF
jgi:hypothetical protein